MAEMRCNQLLPLSSGERPGSPTVRTDLSGEEAGEQHSFPRHQHKANRDISLCRYVTKESKQTTSAQPPIGGKITLFYDNSAKIAQDPWVLETIKVHQIEFTQTPHLSFISKMHISSRNLY